MCKFYLVCLCNVSLIQTTLFLPSLQREANAKFFPRPLSLHVYTASTMSLESESHQLHFKSFKYIVEAILKSHLFLLSSLQLLTLTPGIRQLDQ